MRSVGVKILIGFVFWLLPAVVAMFGIIIWSNGIVPFEFLIKHLIDPEIIPDWLEKFLPTLFFLLFLASTGFLIGNARISGYVGKAFYIIPFVGKMLATYWEKIAQMCAIKEDIDQESNRRVPAFFCLNRGDHPVFGRGFIVNELKLFGGKIFYLIFIPHPPSVTGGFMALIPKELVIKTANISLDAMLAETISVGAVIAKDEMCEALEAFLRSIDHPLSK